MAGGDELVPGGEGGDDQQEVGGAVAVQAVAQAGLLQAGGQVLHGAQAPGLELGDDRERLGLGAGQAEQVTHQRGVDGPDPGSGDGDLAERLGRVAEFQGGEQPVEAGAGEQVGGHAVQQVGDRREMAVQGGPGHARAGGEPAGDRTRVSMSATAEPHGLFRLLAPVMAAGVRRQVKADHRRLKTVLEHPSPVAGPVPS